MNLAFFLLNPAGYYARIKGDIMKSSRGLRFNTLAMMILLLVQMGGFTPNAQAAAKSVTATAKYDKKSGKVVVKGKTSQSIQPSAQISVFDPGTQKLLYSASTDPKRNFNLNLLAATAIPCLVRVKSQTLTIDRSINCF